MTKHVEVAPSEAIEAIARRTAASRHPKFPWHSMSESERSVFRANARLDLEAALPSIYKHFCDRLLDVEAEARIHEQAERISGLALTCDQVRAVLHAAALQATSIPEVDRGLGVKG